MKQRKRKLVNKKFQIKTSIKLAFVSLIPLIIILVMVLFIKIDTEEKLGNGLVQLNEAVTTEDNIIQAYLEIARVYKDKEIKLAAKNVSTDHEKSIKVIKDYINKLDIRITYLGYLFYIISGLICLHAVFFFFYIIRYTHRISGPVYLMEKMVKSLIADKKTDNRTLRKKDEFKELYNELCLLNKKINKIL